MNAKQLNAKLNKITRVEFYERDRTQPLWRVSYKGCDLNVNLTVKREELTIDVLPSLRKVEVDKDGRVLRYFLTESKNETAAALSLLKALTGFDIPEDTENNYG